VSTGPSSTSAGTSAADAGLTDDGGFGVADFTAGEAVLLTPEARLVGDYTLQNKLQSLKWLQNDRLSIDIIYHYLLVNKRCL